MEKLIELEKSHDVPLWTGEFGAHNAEWVASTMEMFENPENHVSGWIFWPWKRVPEFNTERWRHLAAIQPTPEGDAVRTALAFPIDPENPLAQHIVGKGMGDFIDAIRGENLILDPEMREILTGFQE